jgi:hypothetical protein
MRQAVSTGQVYANDFVPGIVFKIFQQVKGKYASVVHQNIDVLKLIYCSLDQCVDALKGPDVGRNAVCVSTFLHNVVDDPRHLLLSSRVDDYSGAFPGKQERDGLADSLTGSGDKGYLAIEALARPLIHSAASAGAVISAPGIGLK